MNKKGVVFLIVAVIVLVVPTVVGIINQRAVEKNFIKTMPEQVEQIGMKAMEHLLNNDIEGLKKLFVKEILNDKNIDEQFENIYKYLSDIGEYRGKQIISYYINNNNGLVTQNITLELEYSKRYVVYTYMVSKLEGEYRLLRFHSTTNNISITEANKFRFDNKGLMHYVILLLAFVTLIFSLVTAAVCFSKDRKRRILWTIFCLCGIGAFTFGWNTGQCGIKILSFGFPCVKIIRFSTYASLILYLRLPLGAILYWLCKHNETQGMNIEKSEECQVGTTSYNVVE